MFPFKFLVPAVHISIHVTHSYISDTSSVLYMCSLWSHHTGFSVPGFESSSETAYMCRNHVRALADVYLGPPPPEKGLAAQTHALQRHQNPLHTTALENSLSVRLFSQGVEDITTPPPYPPCPRLQQRVISAPAGTGASEKGRLGFPAFCFGGSVW